MNPSIDAGLMRPSNASAHPVSQTVVAFGETLVDQFRDHSVMNGAPFNVACHLAALGAHPVLVTRAGKDDLGDQLLQIMAARGLDRLGVQRDPGRPTGRVKVTETDNGQSFSILSNQAYDYIHASLARKVGMSVRPEMVYFGTLSQRGDSRRALRDMLGAVNARVFLDVNLRDPWVDAETLRWSLQQARVVKLNTDELMRVSTLLSLHGETPEARASKLVSGFDLERLLVTCGEAGAWTLDRAGRIEFVTGPSIPHIVDTAGAGDGFAAIVILGMLRGWSLTDQLARADAFARALCRIQGAVPASKDFYVPFIRDWRFEAEATRA
ncbi:MAG: PfkB family carbohydrate kinase [Thiobacillus sp.]